MDTTAPRNNSLVIEDKIYHFTMFTRYELRANEQIFLYENLWILDFRYVIYRKKLNRPAGIFYQGSVCLKGRETGQGQNGQNNI